MIDRLLIALAALIPAAALAQAQPAIDGDWDGGLRIPAGMELPLTLHLSGDKPTLDSPDQNARGVPITVTREGEKLIVALPGNGRLEGTVSADGRTMEAMLSQGGNTLPAHFTRRAAGAAAPTLARPQQPQPPFPYASEDVTFPSGGVTLAGTLTRPPGKARVPTIVLVAGSGPQNRDETVEGHRPFLLLADRLTRAGFAVLRYDKRGVAKSGGKFATATDVEFIADAQAALAYVRTRADVDARHIGLIGHSEGAELAPDVARRDGHVAFLVLLSLPGVRGDQVILSQKAAIEKAMGLPEGPRAQSLAAEQAILQTLLNTPDPVAARASIVAQLGMLGVPSAKASALADEAVSPGFRALISYDPQPALKALHQPVLVIAGSKDLQVIPEVNLPAIRAALAGNRQAEIVELPGLNHLLQPATTGTPAEYRAIPITIDPSALDLIVHWAKAQAG